MKRSLKWLRSELHLVFKQKLINSRYEILRSIGQGGMASVHLVQDHREGEFVALKSFRRPTTREEEIDLLKHEFLLLSSLHHPNVAEVHDFGVVEGSEDYFFTTEFIDGNDLWKASDNFSWDDYYEVVAQICRGLSYIHSRRLIHHDVKPSNLLVKRLKSVEGEVTLLVKLIDFGLASTIQETGAGAIRGTVSYIAPEVGRSAPSDQRSDLYSLGVTLYHCVTRSLPFQGETNLEVIRAHVKEMPVDPREHRSDIPDAFVDLILRLMAKDPTHRYSSAEEVIDALSHIAGREFEVETRASAVGYVNSGRFVGRDAAFNTLKELFSNVFPASASVDLASSGIFSEFTEAEQQAGASAGAQLLFVRGESGIGKSRLLREFRHHVQLNRVNIIEGRSSQGADSYGPLAEALRSLLGLWDKGGLKPTDTLRRRLVRRHGVELSKILPELSSETLGESTVSLAPERERLRLFDHIARFFLDFARSRPLVVYLHDLHGADEASLDFLEYFSRTLFLESKKDNEGRPIRLLVIGSVRDSSDAKAVVDLVDLLVQRGEARTLQLNRLKREQLASLLDSMLGQGRYPKPLVESIYEESKGNPYFIVELMRSLAESGALKTQAGQWTLDTGSGALQLPSSVRDVILQRLSRLGQSDLLPLRLLATFGRALTAYRFSELAEQSLEFVVTLFEDLVEKQILDRVTRGIEREYEFMHDLMREAIYAAMTAEEVAALHKRCGDFLELYVPEMGLKNPAALAHHFELGGDRTRALTYFVKAADAALVVHDNDRSIAYYKRGLDFLGSDCEDRRRQQLLEHLGKVQTLVGDYSGARQSFRETLEQCKDRLGALDQGRLYRLLGEVEGRCGDYDEALQCYSIGTRQLGREMRSQEGAKLLAATASIYSKKGLYDLAINFCESGLDLLSGFPEEDDTAAIRMILGAAREFKGDLKPAAREFELSLALRRRARNRLGTAESLTKLGSVAMSLGRIDDAVARFEQALALQETLGHRQGMADSATHLGRALGARGESERALSLHRRALAIKERIGDVEGIVITYNDLGCLTLELGDYLGASDYFDQAHNWNSDLGEIRESVRAYNGQAELGIVVGRLAEAEQAAGEALRLATVHEMSREQGSAYRFLGLVAREQGDDDRAERLLHRAIAMFSRSGANPDIAQVTLDVVDVFVERGDADLAEMALTKLKGQLESLDHQRIQARFRLASAQLLGARQRLRQAIEMGLQALHEAKETKDSELHWWACYVVGRLYERARDRDKALSCYVDGMETIRLIFDQLTGSFKDCYVKLPRRGRLAESFRKLRTSAPW
jgi:serine/threonine protein kinase/tetratricopeptide (TPR) repeat protein